jgi:hypothetical protein
MVDCGNATTTTTSRGLGDIEDRAVVEKILTHLGLPADPPCPLPARTPEWLPGVRRAADHEHAGGHWADC